MKLCFYNPLTPLDLIPFPLDTSFIHKEGVSRLELMEKLHKRVRNQIENQIKVYATKGNRGRRLCLMKGIGFCSIIERIDFLLRESTKLALEVVALFRSWIG